jgi:hypothetical protein
LKKASEDGTLNTYLADMGINEDTIKSFGFDSMEAFTEGLNLENIAEDWAELTDIVSLEGTEELSLTAAKNIKESVD